MTKERLEQLLIRCMDWIETDTEETMDTFHYLGFEPKEVTELGFGYLVKNQMKHLKDTAKEIAEYLSDSEFDDVTDSSGCYFIRVFPDESDRSVDVYRSTNDGSPQYVVCCSYEDGSTDYKYTDDLKTESLERVLKEIYNEEFQTSVK